MTGMGHAGDAAIPAVLNLTKVPVILADLYYLRISVFG